MSQETFFSFSLLFTEESRHGYPANAISGSLINCLPFVHGFRNIPVSHGRGLVSLIALHSSLRMSIRSENF